MYAAALPTTWMLSPNIGNCVKTIIFSTLSCDDNQDQRGKAFSASGRDKFFDSPTEVAISLPPELISLNSTPLITLPAVPHYHGLLMALFHCMVRYGTVHFWGVFHWVMYLVPGTFLVLPRPGFQASRTVTKT